MEEQGERFAEWHNIEIVLSWGAIRIKGTLAKSSPILGFHHNYTAHGSKVLHLQQPTLQPTTCLRLMLEIWHLVRVLFADSTLF